VAGFLTNPTWLTLRSLNPTLASTAAHPQWDQRAPGQTVTSFSRTDYLSISRTDYLSIRRTTSRGQPPPPRWVPEPGRVVAVRLPAGATVIAGLMGGRWSSRQAGEHVRRSRRAAPVDGRPRRRPARCPGGGSARPGSGLSAAPAPHRQVNGQVAVGVLPHARAVGAHLPWAHRRQLHPWGVVDERAAVVASARRLAGNALGADLDVLPRAYELCTTRE
jgi:hypothetical protein